MVATGEGQPGRGAQAEKATPPVPTGPAATASGSFAPSGCRRADFAGCARTVRFRACTNLRQLFVPRGAGSRCLRAVAWPSGARRSARHPPKSSRRMGSDPTGLISSRGGRFIAPGSDHPGSRLAGPRLSRFSRVWRARRSSDDRHSRHLPLSCRAESPFANAAALPPSQPVGEVRKV